jgi:lysozyme
MNPREKKLLVVLGVTAALYLLSRTQKGQAMSESLAANIAKLIAGHEGDVLTVYQDQGGLWTVGKGHLIKPGERFYPYGGSMLVTNTGQRTITQAESDDLFALDTAAARNAVAGKVIVPLNDNQRAALVSLVFNIGSGAFAGSTLLKKLNTGDFNGAADQFLVWKKVAGVDSQGLINRRASERALFLS